MLLSAGLLSGPVAAGALSGHDAELYREAFRLVQGEHWGEAEALAAGAREALPGKVIRWLDLARPRGGHAFIEIAEFIRDNPGWPNQTGLMRQAEETMPPDLAAAQVVAWFDEHAPVSAIGTARYADALRARGEAGRAAALVRRFWIEGGFSTIEDEATFGARFGLLLRPEDHLARLDRLLWDHHTAAALRVLPLVDAAHRAAAEARIAFIDDRSDLEEILTRVPAALENDPGLAYERLHWRRKKDNTAGAIDGLEHPPAELVRPALWWSERNLVARRLLERGDAATAYRLVASHGLKEGQPLAEAEFLAGWLALTHLGKPEAAYGHFQRMLAAVSSPMSRSRGAYWSARAAEADGKAELAGEWYAKAATAPTMFYGQLSLAALGKEGPLALPPEPSVPAAEAAGFERRELVRVARELAEIDPVLNTDRIGLFLRRMIRDATTPAEWELLARMATELHQPEEAIFAAKQAFQGGVTLIATGYPAPVLAQNGGIETGLALALIRQESSFNTWTISGAGARGLMQLMPGTARQVAGKLGLPADDARLTRDPDYNIRLGTTYMRGLIDRYGGSYLLAIAAYNAGTSRVDEWLSKLGDPRGRAIDPLDWMESIPFNETRNYVQRVLEALQVYRQRLGAGGNSLKRDLIRG